jgi:hypothetical protein
MTRGPGHLIDHVTTVTAYLNDYKSDPEKHDDYSVKFSCYLLTTCWKKILRRTRSWQGMGFIRFLTKLSSNDLQLLIKAQPSNPFPSHDRPGDKTLKEFLRHSVTGLQGDPRLQSLILDHIPPEAHSTSNSEPFKFEVGRLTGSTPLFSEESIPEFHYLVIAAFIGFAIAFKEVGDAYHQLVRIDYQALEMY